MTDTPSLAALDAMRRAWLTVAPIRPLPHEVRMVWTRFVSLDPECPGWEDWRATAEVHGSTCTSFDMDLYPAIDAIMDGVTRGEWWGWLEVSHEGESAHAYYQWALSDREPPRGLSPTAHWFMKGKS
jgi:hypothetical protein